MHYLKFFQGCHMKKLFQLSLVILTTSFALCICARTLYHKSSGNTLNEHQIENYVETIVASLFNNYSSQDQKKICKQITKKILDKTSWEKSYNIPVERTTQEVYAMTLGGIVDFVEKQSFDLAKIESGNYEISVQVSNLLRNEVEKKIASTGTFSEGALRDYIGKNLEYKVRSTCNMYYIPSHNVAKRYDEKSCRICFSHYGPSLPWVYLSPCGHDMCTNCAQTYFFEQNKQRCPVCGKQVDTYQIREAIYQPSAPWF